MGISLKNRLSRIWNRHPFLSISVCCFALMVPLALGLRILARAHSSPYGPHLVAPLPSGLVSPALSVRDPVTEPQSREEDRLRAELFAIKTDPLSAVCTQIVFKAEKVAVFPFRKQADGQEACRAVTALRRFFGTREFHVEGMTVGTLTKELRTFLVWAVGKDAVTQLRNNAWEKAGWGDMTAYRDGKSARWTMEDAPRVVSWKPGQRLRVEWRWNARWGVCDTVLADWESDADDPIAFLRFIARHDLAARDDSRFGFSGNPVLEVSCREFPAAAADLAAIEKYIFPGTYWNR